MQKKRNKCKKNPWKVICPYCNTLAKFVRMDEFKGKHYGTNWYVCYDCDARVGTHKLTKVPKGRLANKKLRQLRIYCHNLLDPYWKKGKYTRTEVYERLAKAMDLPVDKTHIAMFDEKQCIKVIGLFNRKQRGHVQC